MRKLLSILQYITLSTIIIGAFWIFWKLSTTTLYSEYTNLWNYRRLHPDFLPNSKTEKILSFGHETSYAGISWIKLIQFIGDNIRDGEYLKFTHTILVNITNIHPYFTRAYELDLIMAPFSGNESTEKHEQLIWEILDHGKIWIKNLCDKNKIEQIEKLPINQALLNHTELRNPCKNGMIPYYMGYHYGNILRDGEMSEYYYKIASMQDDSPKASSFLAILAKAAEWNYINSALSFLLIASSGYDVPPYTCQSISLELSNDVIKKRKLEHTWIKEIEKKESTLKENKDSSVPESFATTNCFDSVERGIKQLYIAYIDDISRNYPDIQDSRELVTIGAITHTPTIQSQSGFFLKKNDEWIWKYRLPRY